MLLGGVDSIFFFILLCLNCNLIVFLQSYGPVFSEERVNFFETVLKISHFLILPNSVQSSVSICGEQVSEPPRMPESLAAQVPYIKIFACNPGTFFHTFLIIYKDYLQYLIKCKCYAYVLYLGSNNRKKGLYVLNTEATGVGLTTTVITLMLHVILLLYSCCQQQHNMFSPQIFSHSCLNPQMWNSQYKGLNVQ